MEEQVGVTLHGVYRHSAGMVTTSGDQSLDESSHTVTDVARMR